MADVFKVRLEDDPVVNPQARESAYRWAGDRVEIVLYNTTSKVAQQADANGVYAFPAGTARQAIVTNVSRAGASRSPIIWRKVSGFEAVLAPNVEQNVTISGRLRMSVWAFTPPFTKRLVGSDIELDINLLALVRNAGIDDLSLVYTIAWDQRTKPSELAKSPRWHRNFLPLGSPDHRETYLRKLIDAFHKMGAQVLAGYELVKGTKKPQDLTDKDKQQNEYAQDFADWLINASPSEIDAYARSINNFFESRHLDIDGIGFDLEFDELKEVHRSNLGLLYQKTSDAMAHHNGIVSYANAPFVEDGVSQNGFMKAQPFALAAAGLNLIARPMCFDAAASTSISNIEASIACALRRLRNPKDPNDTSKPGGAGLHPSQVQFGIWVAKVSGGVEKLCADLLRPNRIGLMLYNLSPSASEAKIFLTNCQKWNQALNPSEGPPGRRGLPLQAPW
jgi:hypothetical protein